MTKRGQRTALWATAAGVCALTFICLILGTWASPLRIARVHDWLTRAGPVLSREEIVGTWTAADGGKIVMRNDGTFIADRLPNEIFDDYSRAGSRKQGSGTWQMAAPIVDPTGPKSQIALEFDQLTGFDHGYAIQARVGRHNGRAFIYFLIGDPDLDRTYELYRE